MPSKKHPSAQVVEKAVLPGGLVEVRALADNESNGLRAGRLAQVPAEIVGALRAAHLVDDHPDAVAYAKSLEG